MINFRHQVHYSKSSFLALNLMMQKYLGSSIENKKVDGDCGKAESVQKFLIIYLKRADSQTCKKYVKGQHFFSIPSMKTFKEQVLWNILYILRKLSLLFISCTRNK